MTAGFQSPLDEQRVSRHLINGDDNIVRISKLKHWVITGWYMKKNMDFGGVSPRTYLRGKSWEERRQVGLDALKKFGVLEP